MTTAHVWSPPPDGQWTVADLDAIPDDGRRREIIDGVPYVSPSPTRNHQIIAARLTYFLMEMCPPEYDVTQAVDVRRGERNSLNPDVLVTTAEAATTNPCAYRSGEVVLAVEIVSPGSRFHDRVRKPRAYAAMGVPHYWRIEPQPELAVHVHELSPETGGYVETAVLRDVIEVARPWRIVLPIPEITPRKL